MDNCICSIERVRLGPVSRPRLTVESLQIPQGISAVLGKSGAGKTSLLNVLVGFELAEQGEATFSSQAHADQLHLSWVPADFGLWAHLRVREHLEVVAGNDTDLIENLTNHFDLSDCGSQLPATLSMGERARLAVARSLATKAAVHIMDEPFAHVDPARVDRYWNFVRSCLRDDHASLIFASHSPHVVLREAENIICVDSGRVTWTGSPSELYQSPPSHALGALLGPLNWFKENDICYRNASSDSFRPAARPEKTVLEVIEESEQATDSLPVWSVQENWQLGSHQESVLKKVADGSEQTVYHSSPTSDFPAGTKVAIKLITSCLLLVCLLMNSGCQETAGNERILSVEGFKQYLLPSEGAMLPAARGMTYSPDGELLILDNVGRVLKYDAAGKLLHKWWMPDYEIGRPEGICFMQDGRLAVADTHYNRVVIFDENCEVSSMFGESGYEPGQFIYSSAVAQDDEGFLYVAEYGGNDRIQKFTKEGEFVLEFGAVGAEDGEFQRPSGLVWYDDVLYVADAINNRVQAFNAQGDFLRVVADAHTAELYYPYDISLGPNETLFVIEYGAGRMTQIKLDGTVLGRYGTEGRGEQQFWTPWGIAASQSGKIAVADTGNRRVVELQLN